MERIERVAVIGAGIMGTGIAASIFKYGFEVRLFDVNKDILRNSCELLRKRARRSQDPEKIVLTETLKEAVEGADLIIEAIIENLETKCGFYAELGKTAPSSAVFASNTSSLSISEMAESSGRPGKFLGLHFFNPPVLMRLVEVTVTGELEDDALEGVMDFLKNIKKTGIKCMESPGFVVNRILLPVVFEAFHILKEKSEKSGRSIIETANEIDSAILNAGIFPMGPLDLADLTGIDTIYSVSEVLYRGFNKSPRFTPSPFIKSFIDRGYTGRKTGKGVYNYNNTENDPDLNPILDERGNKIERIESPEFNYADLLSVAVNEAFLVLEEGIVASYEDIEICMELGTRWPKGPFKMVKEYGKERLLDVLKRRYSESGNNPRYRPGSLWENPTKELAEYFS